MGTLAGKVSKIKASMSEAVTDSETTYVALAYHDKAVAEA